MEAAASTENVHENVIPPQGAPVPSKKGGKKKFIIGGIVAVVLILIAVMIGTSGGNTGSTSTDTYIETVRKWLSRRIYRYDGAEIAQQLL